MFSLQRLFCKDGKFFDLLETSAQEVCNNIEALTVVLKQPEPARALSNLNETRRKGKKITEEIGEQLCRTFITPLEREDIEALSESLYKIPKVLEKFCERFVRFQQSVGKEDFSKQVMILEQSAFTLSEMVRSLRQNPKLDIIKDQKDRLQHLEGDGDRLMLDLLYSLYNSSHDHLQTTILRDLYELLEKAIDRCRDAGNVVFHIVLKNS